MDANLHTRRRLPETNQYIRETEKAGQEVSFSSLFITKHTNNSNESP